MQEQETVRRGAAYLNRRRAARACDGCRKVKEKCEGGIPCRRCTHLQRPCGFSQQTNRGHTSAPSHDAAGNASAMAASPETLRRMSNMERLLTHFVGKAKMDSETLQNLADSVDIKKDVDSNAPNEALDHDLLDAQSEASEPVKVDEVSFQPLENNATHYSGEFSNWNFSMRIKNWIEQTGPHRTDAPDAPKIKEFYRFEELQSPTDASGLSSSFPPRQIAEFLARAFFNHAENNYFYVDRTWLNRKLDAVFENPASLSRRDVPTLCIMYMVLAVGTQYAYLNSRATRNVPECAPFSEDNLGIMLYQQACKLLPDVIAIASLESVQACLLIGLYASPLDPSGLSWTYLNLASKLAIQNGMHRRYPGEGLDLVVRETRTRIWWTLYVLEKRIGTLHGRPISVLDSEVDADWPAEKPDIWPGSPPSNTPHLLASLHLCRVLAKISHEISLFKMYDKRVTFCALTRLVEIKQDLHRWWQDVPAEIHFQDVAAGTGVISRRAAHVRLEFCVIRMYSGRLFIMPRSAPTNASPSTDGPSPEDPRTPSVLSPQNAQKRSILIEDCVDAALCIVDTCRLLHDTIGLARASYTEFSALRVALLVILSQFLQKQTSIDKLRQPLHEGMEMLKNMSTWGASARFDVSLIEAFEHAIARMETKDSGSRLAPSQDSDYDMFKKWEEGWHSSKATQQQAPREDKTFDPSLGIPSLTGNVATDAWATSVPKQTSMPMLGGGSGGFFGIDGNFPSMPMLESLSATLGHGYGFEGANMESSAGPGRSNTWM